MVKLLNGLIISICRAGEQRFEWSSIHEAYQMQFEEKLNGFLREESVKPEEFEAFLLRFKEKRDRATQGYEDELRAEFGDFADDIDQVINIMYDCFS